MSKLLRVGVALAATVAVTACGGGSGSGSSSGSTDTAPSTSAATAAATAINLVKADLPGYNATPHDSSSDSDPDNVAFASCVGASAPNSGDVVDLYSEDFEKGTQLDSKQVSSEVTVVKSQSTARKDLKAFQGDKTKTCLETFVGKLLTKQAGEASGVTFATPTISRLDPQGAGTDGTFGYSVTTTAKAAGLSLPFEITIQGLLVKHTGTQLTTLSVGGPFPAADRDALFAKLVERSKSSAV